MQRLNVDNYLNPEYLNRAHKSPITRIPKFLKTTWKDSTRIPQNDSSIRMHLNKYLPALHVIIHEKQKTSP